MPSLRDRPRATPSAGVRAAGKLDPAASYPEYALDQQMRGISERFGLEGRDVDALAYRPYGSLAFFTEEPAANLTTIAGMSITAGA